MNAKEAKKRSTQVATKKAKQAQKEREEKQERINNAKRRGKRDGYKRGKVYKEIMNLIDERIEEGGCFIVWSESEGFGSDATTEDVAYLNAVSEQVAKTLRKEGYGTTVESGWHENKPFGSDPMFDHTYNSYNVSVEVCW